MDLHNIKNLRALAEALSNKLADSERYFTSVLATRLTKAAIENPQDITLRSMATYLEQKAENGKHLISRAELKDVYNRLYTTNNKVAFYLEKELGSKADKLPIRVAKREDENETILNIRSMANPQLINSLESLFSKKSSVAKVDPKLGAFASIVCKKNLPGNPVVEAITARPDVVICKASYETPKGQGNVIVPIHVVESLPVAPSTFVSKTGFVKITPNNIEQHLIATVGEKLTLNADKLFEAIDLAKYGEPDPVSDVEHIVMLNRSIAERGETPAEYDTNAILTNGFDKVKDDLKLPRSAESYVFEKNLSEPTGLARLAFGDRVLNKARSIVLNSLRGWGFDNPQVKITDATDKEVTISASINGCGFDVPVKIINSNVSLPKMILADGGIGLFTKEGVQEAIKAADRAIGAKIAGYNLDRPEQLIEQVRVACDNGDMAIAASALDALSACKDSRAFAAGFAIYSEKTLGNEVVKTAETKKIQKLKTIKIGGNEVCAKTGLPADKVYVDANGEVQLKSRRNKEHTDDYIVGGFMNSKILLGM